VKTEAYTQEQVGKVVQLRAAVEGLQLGPGVLDRLAAEGERGSLRSVHRYFVLLCFAESGFRYALQLLTPASILAQLAGRKQIEEEDVAEMNELFLDAKTSAGKIADDGGFDGGRR
jgi:RuvB-like protein 1 (pontin 52)